MASTKRYTLPRGPFIHVGEQITEDTVDKAFAKMHKSAQADYLAAGYVADAPPESPAATPTDAEKE